MARSEDRPVPFPKVASGVEGLITRKQANWLYNTPSRLGDGLYADLGTYHGRSALCLAGGLKDNDIKGHVVTVDAYDGRGLTGRFRRKLRSLDTVRETIKERGVEEYVTPIEGDASSVPAEYQDKEFNFVFIDAGHDQASCTADFNAWSPLVKQGGEIAFHDSHYKGVDRTLHKILKGKEWEVCCSVGEMKVLRKL